MSGPFTRDKDDPATNLLIKWWQGLEDDKGTRAELRRCDRPEAVMLEPAYVRLRNQLYPHLAGQWNWESRLALVVGLLAHIRHSDNDTLAKQMAGGDPPTVSELRFRRLLKCTPDDIYGRMIRIIRMLDNKAELGDLIASIFHWNDRVRKRWARDYFTRIP